MTPTPVPVGNTERLLDELAVGHYALTREMYGLILLVVVVLFVVTVRVVQTWGK